MTETDKTPTEQLDDVAQVFVECEDPQPKAPRPTERPDYAQYERVNAAFSLLQAEVLPLNKTALFAALANTGIHSIVVSFDGSGDSGQIESVDAFGPDSETLALPNIEVEFNQITFGSPVVTIEARELSDVLEYLAYDLLEMSHAGWENNDGADGTFTFNVAAGSITLDYNERYVATNYSQHEF